MIGKAFSHKGLENQNPCLLCNFQWNWTVNLKLFIHEKINVLSFIEDLKDTTMIGAIKVHHHVTMQTSH